MKTRLTLFTSAFAILLCSYQAFGTHLRSGEIIVKQIPGGYSCQITVKVWTSTKNTPVLFGGDQDWLDFGDNSPLKLVPEQQNVIVDPALGIGYAEYTIVHTYAGPGRYVVSYQEPNRNMGILNIANSANTLFYLETSFLFDPFITAPYATPEFLSPPIFLASPSVGYSFSLAAEDVNDYTLYYELSVPQMARQTPVTGYVTPDGLSLNAYNGLVTWDGKFQGIPVNGEFLITVKIYQIHDGIIVGYVIRDVQILAEQSAVTGAISDDQGDDPNGRIFIEESQTAEIKISATSTSNTVTMEAFSSLGDENFSFETTPEQGQASGTIKLKSTPDIVRDNPYMITVRTTIDLYTRDVTYLFYTKDIQPTVPDALVVLGNEHDAASTNIYPNPVKDFLKLDFPNSRNLTVEILNQQGVRIQQHSVSVDRTVDLRALPSGFYVCEVRGGNGLVTRKKIIKE